MGIFNEHSLTPSDTVSSGELLGVLLVLLDLGVLLVLLVIKVMTEMDSNLILMVIMTWKTRSSQMFETEIMIMMSWLKVR